MVRKTLSAILSKISGLKEAAFWLSLFTLFSQILALVRDRLLAHHFGAGADLDVYYAAFRIPDLIFVTAASLVSISALVPLFARKETEGEKHLKDATDSIFTVFSVMIVIFCGGFYFALPYLVPIFFAGLSGGVMSEVVNLSRILLLSPLLLGFSNFFGSIVQYEKRFILYSISPILYNLGIVFGLVFGVDSFGISAAIFGVILGALLHASFPAVFVMFSPKKPNFTWDIKWSDVWETAYLSIPRTLALSVTSFVGLIFVSLASGMQEGSITVFNFSFNLESVPLALIGVSFSLAAFPGISASAARKDKGEVISQISDGLRQIIFWSLPTVVLFIVLRAHIVRVILGSGSFDWDATRLTAAMFALFVVSSVFQSIQLFLSRALYALGKTFWPLVGNLLAGVIAVVLSLMFLKADLLPGIIESVAKFLKVAHLSTDILALPISYSVGAFVGALFLFFALGKELVFGVWQKMRPVVAESILGAATTGVLSYVCLNLLDRSFGLDTFWGVFGHGFLSGILGIAAGAFVLYLLGSVEMKEIVTKLNSKIFK
jgi:putative peptidoglycan lipid II flippase